MILNRTASELVALERRIGCFRGNQPGPTLIAVGGIHGNEPAGVWALGDVCRRLQELQQHLSGDFVAVAGNLAALRAGRRHLGTDLNRGWTPEAMQSLKVPPVESLQGVERERRELLDVIQQAVGQARGPVFVLDLHTTSNAGAPFASVRDRPENVRFGLSFPVSVVLGLEETLSGTMLEYLGRVFDVTTMAFEAGQHASPSSIANHAALVWLALQQTQMLPGKQIPALEALKTQLEESSWGYPRLFEVLYRHSIGEAEGFLMHPGYHNFDIVHRSQHLATDRHGEICAPRSGMLLMPLYQGLGDDGFFLGKRVRLSKLQLFFWARRLRLPRLLPFLPGIRRAPGPDFRVRLNAKAKRLYPDAIFRFLGLRRSLQVNGWEIRSS